MSRESIFREITSERNRQDRLYGGPDHDDRHSMMDWVGLIVRHLGLAVDDGKPAGGAANSHSLCDNPARWRLQMVRVAAVAVAAMEAFDRKVHDQSTRTLLVDKPVVVESPVISPEVLAWWQAQADARREVLLLLSRRNPAGQAEGGNCLYAVSEGMATTWEKANCETRLEPIKEVQA